MESLQPANRVHFAGGPSTLGALIAEFDRRVQALRLPAAPLALCGDEPARLLAAAGWLAQTGADGLIVSRERLTPALHATLRERGFAIVDVDRDSVVTPAASTAPQHGRVTLLTSGTTGAPKLLEHSWTSLFTMAKVRNLAPENWLLSFREGTYAWYQLVTLALFRSGQELTLPERREPLAMLDAAVRHGVTAISAPPTFWRLLLLQAPRDALRRLAPRRITLGGERVDQEILDRLREFFPAATLSHIYASTEAGGCIVVHDGREGFPAAWLAADAGETAAADRPALRLRDGRLWIRSPHGAAQYRDWFDSGDAAEVRGDRVVVLGRADRSVANVGGMKVALCDVERALLRHPSVAWCRAQGVRAPFMGELVAVDLVPRDRADEGELTRFCAANLADYMVPRRWTFLETIPVTDNLKTCSSR